MRVFRVMGKLIKFHDKDFFAAELFTEAAGRDTLTALLASMK
jgi:hypothetical protein